MYLCTISLTAANANLVPKFPTLPLAIPCASSSPHSTVTCFPISYICTHTHKLKYHTAVTHMSIDHVCSGSSGVNGHRPPNNSAADQTTTENGAKFSSYYDEWIERQRYDLQTLLAATSAYSPSATAEQEQETCEIQHLIDQVVSNYENYYIHKSKFAEKDVKLMFSPSWTSTTENMFLWVGGWRPTMAFHLFYSKFGIQLESHLTQVINGTPTHDLSGITHSQMQQIDELQMMTVHLEREISEKLAEIQETGANKRMVELVHVITEIGGSGGGENEGMKMLKPQIEKKEQNLKKVLEEADQLRMDTLRGVISVLKPLQALHFLIAAAELHLRVHEYGKSMDAQRALAT